jgi:tRNA pseudouridine55 synthase
MGRRNKGNPVHGWLVLDKPFGLTSTHALAQVKRLFNAQKAGHAGTLDPLATGILPIAFGEATKTVSYAVDGEKSYRFVVRWGVETTTDDAEGPAAKTSDLRPSPEAIAAQLKHFTGEIMQVPPQFSAIKVDGDRAYDLARNGETIELVARPVIVDALRIIEHTDAETTVFEADCGKGTYVRALARDMGRALGCYGHVVGLRRTRVGPFSEDNAITIDELREIAEAEGAASLGGMLQPVEAALNSLTELSISPSDAASLCSGQPVLIRGRDAPVLSGPVYAMSKGRLIALGEMDRGAIRPTRVFNYS